MTLRLVSRPVSVLIVTAFLGISSYVNADTDEIRLYIPAFEGPGDLGKNVATILNLQIWRTLRMEPDKDPQGEDFGRGMIVWGESPLEIAGHITAEIAATLDDNISSQFVFWGEIFPYGNGVIGQTYLSIPVFSNYQQNGLVANDYRDNFYELWKLSVTTSQNKYLLKVDIPNRRYEFSPIVLSNSIVEKYSLPSKLKMYEKADRSSKVIGEVGNKYIGIEPRGHYQKVYSEGKRGWVYLPNLAKERNEVVDFIGGLIRIYRADWYGAKDLMEDVIKNKSTSTALKIDALLYKGRCMEEIGKSGEEAFQLAFKLNPFNHHAVRYWVMSRLSILVRLDRDGVYDEQYDSELTQAKALLEKKRVLFSQTDQWLLDVEVILNYLSLRFEKSQDLSG